MSSKVLYLLVAIFCLTVFSETAEAQNTLGEEGLFIAVPSPVTSEGVSRIRNRIDAVRGNASRLVRKVIFDFNPSGKEAVTTDFGPCYELASYIQKLHGTTTIAFLSGAVTGHSVLPVLACQEIVVSSKAKLGEILPPGSDPPSATVTAAYAEILGKPRESYRAVISKMMDRGVDLGRGMKANAEFFVDLRERARAEKEGVVITDPNSLPNFGPGLPGVFDSTVLRKLLRLAGVSAESKNEFIELYSIAPSSLRGDPLDGRTPSAFRFILRGTVDGAMREAVVRVVKDVARQKGNILFLVLEISGGDVAAAQDLAEKLIELRNEPEPVLVVAVVPDSAPDTAAIVALGCGEIVMSRRKDASESEAAEAEFGDFEALVGKSGRDRVEMLRRSLKDLAVKQGYPEIILECMIDRDIGIVRVHAVNDRSRKKLLTIEQFEADKANWVSDGVVKPKGQLLKLNATKAQELGLARYLTENRDINEVYAIYGLEPSKVREATPGLLDRFATFLRIPGVTVLLVVIGFAGLILELKVPGTTVPGIIAALAFILVFWSQSQFTGQNAVLGGLIFLLGLVLILIEVFVVPGIGVTGILGVLFMVGGIGLATFDKIPQSGAEWMLFGNRIVSYVAALFGAVVIAFMVARYLPNIPYVNRLMLQPPPETSDIPELPGTAEAAGMLGAIGTSATPLRPAGMAQFGEQYIDVVSEGGFIPSGVRVQVVEVEGTRIVVKEV